MATIEIFLVDDYYDPVNSMSFIWNDNMWEKREANAIAISRQRQRADASELHIYPE